MKKTSSQAGVSLVELIIVLAVAAILSAIALISFTGSRKYAAEDQARKIIDFCDEARQKALNQRKTFRVEINKTKKELRLIDEGSKADDASDDVIIKKYPFSNLVTIGPAPNNISGAPTASSPIPVPTYATSSYALSSGNEKITLRFKRTGQVVDAGTNGNGAGSLVSGATIYVYSLTPTGNNPDVIRAVTVLGTTGDTSLFKCKFTSGVCGGWFK